MSIPKSSELNLSPAADAFLAHWKSLPAVDGVPALSSFLDFPDPRFAPITTIIDIGRGEDLPIRLIGTRLVEIFDDHTGEDFLSLIAPETRPKVLSAHRIVTSYPCGWHTQNMVSTTTGRELLIEFTSLPLTNKASGACVAKLAYIVESLDYREALVKLLDLRSSRWIDLGSGTP